MPNGHEFTTLILAVYNADGKGKNLPDATIAKRVKAINGEIEGLRMAMMFNAWTTSGQFVQLKET